MQPDAFTHMYQHRLGRIIAVRSRHGIMRAQQWEKAHAGEARSEICDRSRDKKRSCNMKKNIARTDKNQMGWAALNWLGHQLSTEGAHQGSQGAAGRSLYPSASPWCYKNPISFAASGLTDPTTFSICSPPNVMRCNEREIGRCVNEEREGSRRRNASRIDYINTAEPIDGSFI